MKDTMLRRYLAEAVGTFTIVFAPVALSGVGQFDGADRSLMGAAVVSGLAVLAMIYALGPISAAHFNPAVTLGFAVSRRFPKKYVIPYWIAQFGGAVAAAAVAALFFGAGHGAHIPASDQPLRNIGVEVVLTFFLMLVIISVATDDRVNSTVPAIAIGLTVIFCVLIGGPVTGGSMNPARSFGPALFAGGAAISHVWLYFVGPPIGAVLAALGYEKLRIHHNHAVGAPNELLDALESISEDN